MPEAGADGGVLIFDQIAINPSAKKRGMIRKFSHQGTFSPLQWHNRVENGGLDIRHSLPCFPLAYTHILCSEQRIGHAI